MPATRILLSSLISISALTLSTQACADTLGLRAGVEYWKADLMGEAQSAASRAKKGKPVKFDDWQFYGETYNSVWLNFEHPVPFAPNLRMTYTNIENSKTKTIKHVAGQTVWYTQDSASLIFDNIDFTFYYEVLDNWINLDAGITLRKMDGEFNAISTFGDGLTKPIEDRSPLKEVVPLIYLNGRFDIPFFKGFYVQSVFNGITSSDATFYDADVRGGYDLDLYALEVGVYAGYRRMVLDASNLGGLYADASMDGLMAGLEIHF